VRATTLYIASGDGVDRASGKGEDEEVVEIADYGPIPEPEGYLGGR
jgi:hypothetical protein